MKTLGEFNRNGKVEDAETETVTPFEELHARSAIDEAPVPAEDEQPEPEAETASDETAPAGEEAEHVDADADGHDDRNGEFVPGNQEGAH